MGQVGTEDGVGRHLKISRGSPDVRFDLRYWRTTEAGYKCIKRRLGINLIISVHANSIANSQLYAEAEVLSLS
jgi:hypothetical protein